MSQLEHRIWMDRALAQARLALRAGDVPVGAVVVHGGVVIAEAANQREVDQDPTAHAELLVLRRAAAVLGSWRLEGCALYVTLEPCTMCAGALVLARLPLLVYGAADPKAGAAGSLFNIVQDLRLNHRVEVVSGVLADDCGRLLTRFFQARRGGPRQDREQGGGPRQNKGQGEAPAKTGGRSPRRDPGEAPQWPSRVPDPTPVPFPPAVESHSPA